MAFVLLPTSRQVSAAMKLANAMSFFNQQTQIFSVTVRSEGIINHLILSTNLVFALLKLASLHSSLL